LLLGICSVIPLAVVSRVLLHVDESRFGAASWARHFVKLRNRVIIPLASELSPAQIVVISCLAGFGEELLFRGVLLPHLGVLLSSALFAVAHLGPASLRLFPLTVYYMLAGGYFAGILLVFGDLTMVVVAHALFDILALLYVKVRYARRGE
jgi:membrane protease YdiL (CAAX protease family)